MSDMNASYIDLEGSTKNWPLCVKSSQQFRSFCVIFHDDFVTNILLSLLVSSCLKCSKSVQKSVENARFAQAK